MKIICAAAIVLLFLFSITCWLSERQGVTEKAIVKVDNSAPVGREIIESKHSNDSHPTSDGSKIDSTQSYYRAVMGLSGAQLKEGLHKLIRGHRALSYGQLWDALRDLDRGDDESVILIYDRALRRFDQSGGGQGDWNREHLWPRGYGVRRSSAANTDLHHIRASDVEINGKRGHLYFDETEGEDFGGKKFSNDADSWEPPAEVKGDIARALFYMVVRYEGSEPRSVDLELSDRPDMNRGIHGKLSTLLKWHQIDPVSAAERSRNNKIFRNYQGNRNPFIDHPEWVDEIFTQDNTATHPQK